MSNGDWLHSELSEMRKAMNEGFVGVHKRLDDYIPETEGRLARLEQAKRIGAWILGVVVVAIIGIGTKALGGG